jgi:hypothetical protein
MKLLATVIAVQIASLVSGGLGNAFGFICALAAVFLVFSYLLIAKFGVAPTIELSRKGFRLRFKRLPPS